MELLKSKDNPLIKQYKKICSDSRERKRTGLFAAEGARLCAEAASCKIEIETLLYTDNAHKYEKTLYELLKCTKSSVHISDSLGVHISDTGSPQGIFCLCKIPAIEQNNIKSDGKYILLDNVQDPGNVGTIIRTADAMGITGLFLSPDCVDCYSPKVVRSTMGSLFRLSVLVCDDLCEQIALIKSCKIPCYAATLNKSSLDIRVVNFKSCGAAVIGNEGAGVSQKVIDECGASMIIPMAGDAESLNAGVAAAIAMWELSGKYL